MDKPKNFRISETDVLAIKDQLREMQDGILEGDNEECDPQFDKTVLANTIRIWRTLKKVEQR